MQSGSGEQAPEPEPAAVREAAAPAVLVATEPTALVGVGDEAAEAAAGEAPQVQEAAEASSPVDGGAGGRSPSPAPVSPSALKERQIPVDPASLRRLGMVAEEDSPLSAPSVLTEVVARSSPLLPPLRRPTFVGASLPCSAASSPVHGAGGGAKWDAAAHSPTSALRSLARQHSAALARLVAGAAPPTLSRSASRAEGRTMAQHDDVEPPGEPEKLLAVDEDGFTCGALCMLIPGFSRKKPAFAAGRAVSGVQRQPSGLRPRRSSASRVASLERFECGSWSPPPPPPADCLATEVAKTSCANADDDAEAPVKMAFVFDGGEPPAATRGILKNSASSRLDSSRPSTSSQRHVGFSTAAAASASCPTSPCITPRLARARAEFNAFLEAQSA
ncbi:translation initiation factor IF-2-like [Panicum virgatum]|uniref:Uncharacterized protein n=1 Tax=Panicum virgatum TaxID=38727 RepID=A0A8T0TUF7_PANVG|nr:translation initiation factor IF-2-like [Panicum virgatum]KAG2612456.1 hypothetical protein PVAP13_4KG290700 [Panicum virgatum]